ncbi:threonine/serine exporter family protein [Acetivibrio cellulolyticus]|uniref:threonine/serine exporter family protein n=1 Tax=Acetivibrio cellulolyticus TaxID=35830 RepID=UPI0001E2CBAD|nr:threonine/serine exporter family protein [Acetivibrio cellulolyticus]
MEEIILAFIASLCPAIMYNVTRKNLLWVGLSGMLGWITYAWILESTGNVVISSFLGAVVVGLYSESVARLIKAPAMVFSIPGIFPLVPGIAIYNSTQYISENKLFEAANTGIQAIASAAAIAFGILLISAVFRLLKKRKNKNLRSI